MVHSHWLARAENLFKEFHKLPRKGYLGPTGGQLLPCFRWASTASNEHHYDLLRKNIPALLNLVCLIYVVGNVNPWFTMWSGRQHLKAVAYCPMFLATKAVRPESGRKRDVERK